MAARAGPTQLHAKIVPNQITCSAAISACEKGCQWQLALDLLSFLPGDRPEPKLKEELPKSQVRIESPKRH